MTGPDAATDSARKERLREEAAAWFARMRRDDAARFRSDFETWLGQPEHLAAYNRIAGRFADAKLLKRTGEIHTPARSPKRRTLALITLLLALSAITGAGLFASHRFARPVTVPGTAGAGPAQIATLGGDIRRFHLADGSMVTLDGDSLVTVALGPDARHLRLERGRARFEVAHEARAFVVAAADGSITARGTIFDVSLTEHRVEVALIEGAIDVAASTRPDTAAARAPRRLKAGEAVSFAGGHLTAMPTPAATAPDWSRAIIEVRDARLDVILAEANRHSATKLVAGDATIAALGVSGRFRVDDPTRLADNLAHVLDLELDRSTPGTIMLRRGHKKISSRP